MAMRNEKMPGEKLVGLVAGLIAIAALAVAAVGVSAKYTQKETKVDDTLSSDFYFTSTLLSEEGTTYTLMPETTELKIPLYNYADSLRISNADIQYSYTVTKDGQTIKSENGTLSAGAAQTAYISLENTTTGTYTVKAESSSPYKAVLKATFIVPQASAGVNYSVSDTSGSPYVLLTVWTENYSGNIILNWPAGVIPDSTNLQLAGASTYSGVSYAAGTVTVSGTPYGSNVYRFFKQDTLKSYTDKDFAATAANQ